MATTKALELGQFGTDLTVDDSTGAVTIANDVTINAVTSTGIDDNADQTVITIGSDESVSLAGTLDVNGAEILVGANNSRFAENNLRFNATGSSYIDVNTVGQSLNFRVSNASALDTTALTLSSDGNATFAGELRGPSLFIIDPSTYDTDSDAGSAAGTVRIRGDLIVDGDTTTINSTTLTVDDLNITLASGATNNATADGAGITVDGANATITYDGTNDEWDFNKDVNVTGTVTADGLSVDSGSITIATSGTNTLTSTGTLRFDIDSDNNATDNRYHFTKNAGAGTVLEAREDGDVKFFDASGTNAKFYWDATNEKLGIGTTTPSHQIDLTSSTDGGERGVRVQNTDTDSDGTYSTSGYFVVENALSPNRFVGSNTFTGNPPLSIGTTTSSPVTIATANTIRMTVDTAGNVGIGTTSPTEKLTVLGDILIDNNQDSTLYLGKGVEGVDGVTKIKSVQTGTDSDQLGLAFSVHPSAFGSASTEEAMRIDHNKNVGIGTDDPLDNYAADATGDATKLAVVASTTGSGWYETAHFVAGGDNDNTGAVVRIGQYQNDRGLAIKAGRQASNRAVAHFELRSSNDVDYPILTLKEESANGASLFVGINNNDPSTNLHIVDEADGGASWNTFQQVGRRAGSGDNLHFQTLHDGSDGVNAMAIVIGSARKVEIDKRDSSYTMGVFNDGGQAGDGGALRVVASNRGVGIPDVNVLQVENNTDVLFGVQNNGAIQNFNYLPTTRPSVLFDFANSKELSSKIKFERRGRASYHDANGMVVIADVDEPKIEHNAKTGECLGLLIEPARTNFLPHVSSSRWTWSGSASIELFTQDTLSPAGDYTAAKVYRGTTATYQTINYSTASAVPLGTVWVTFYAKDNPNNPGKFFIQWLDSTYSWQNESWTLSSTTYDDGPHFSSVNQGSKFTRFARYIGNGWYHCGSKLQTGGQNIAFSFHPYANNTSAGTGNTGSDSDTFQYLWGVQLESGEYPTSYIPTWAEEATRPQDLAYVDDEVHKIYKEEDATLFVNAFAYDTTNTSGYPIVRFDDRDSLAGSGGTTGGSNSILNIDLYSDGIAARIGNNGANGTNLEIGDFNPSWSDFTSIGLAYENKTSVIYTHDGYQSSNTGDSVTIIPETKDISRLWFGNTNQQVCIRKFAYWNKYYDINTLNALTEE